MERSPFRCGIGGQFRSAGTRARILGKRKGPERDLAPGPCLVPLTGVEPVRYHYLGILSPVCLPISPQRLIQVSNKILYITTVIKSRNARVQPFSRHKKGDGINPSPLFYFSIGRSDRYQNYSYSLASLVRCSYLSSAILAARSNRLVSLVGEGTLQRAVTNFTLDEGSVISCGSLGIQLEGILASQSLSGIEAEHMPVTSSYGILDGLLSLDHTALDTLVDAGSVSDDQGRAMVALSLSTAP